jgi:hypothetical protein
MACILCVLCAFSVHTLCEAGGEILLPEGEQIGGSFAERLLLWTHTLYEHTEGFKDWIWIFENFFGHG